MLTRGVSAVVALLMLCSSLFASESKGQPKIQLPREQTLYLVGYQWGEPYTFNPLNGWPAWPTRPEFNLMYEPLLTYNTLSGKLEPLLGALYKADNDVVEVRLNPKATWSDGKPLTAEDVLFTYNLNMQNFDTPCNFYVQGYIKSVTTRREAGLEVVSFHVDKEGQNNPRELYNALTNCPIYPKHVFESDIKKDGGLSGQYNKHMAYPQVVSGPYNYYKHSKDVIVVKRRDDYWGNEALHGGKKAAPKYIAHPVYKGNEPAEKALLTGGVDLSANYIPKVWEKEGIQTWYKKAPYHAPASIPMFIINCTVKDKPLSVAKFRRAMALAINYDDIRTNAVSQYSIPMKSGLIIPAGPESMYFSSKEAEGYGYSRYNPDAAKAYLAEIGYESVIKDGKVVSATWNSIPQAPIKITCPAGWTDFEDIIKITVANLNAVGIFANADFVDASTYFGAKYTGTFELYLDTPAGRQDVSMPYNRFKFIFSSKNWKPIGEKMYENTGRFNNPNSPHYIAAIDSLLRVAPLETDSRKLLEIYTQLNRIYMEQQPTIPICYRPEEFYTFNEKFWTGFPSETNSYAPPRIPVSGVSRNILWELKSAVPSAKASGETSKAASGNKSWWKLKK